MFCEKMKNIHNKLDAFAWKRQVEKHKKIIKDRANSNLSSVSEKNDIINEYSIETGTNKQL